MSDSFAVDVSQLVTLSKRYAAAGPIVQDELVNAGERSALAIEGLAKRYAPVDTGTLRRSITHEAKPYAGGVRATAGTNVPYAEAVEKGRRAGASMPPRGVLIASGWLRRHGLPDSAEFVVRRAIARRGIPARPYLIKAFSELKPQIVKEFQAMPGRVFLRLRQAS